MAYNRAAVLYIDCSEWVRHPSQGVTLSPVKSLLPVVARRIQALDQLFVEFVGPVGYELAEDALVQWLASGKTGPSALLRYADIMANNLDSPSERERFLERAKHIALQL